MYNLLVVNGRMISNERDSLILFFCLVRMWWSWKGDNPNPDVVEFMKKNYPVDWTYADFAAQFRAELYG